MRIILVCAIAASALWVDPQICRAQAKAEKKADPKVGSEFQGKPIEYWIKEMNTTPDRARMVFAIEAILVFSADKAAAALPDLIAMHKKGTAFAELDPSVRLAIVQALGVILAANDKSPQFKDGLDRLIAALDDTQYVVRLRALESLQMLGYNASAAADKVRTLANNLNSWEQRRVAIITLIKVANDPKKGVTNDIILLLIEKAKTDPCYQVRLACIDGVTALINSKEKKVLAAHMVERAKLDTDPLVKLKANLAVIVLNDAVDDDSVKRITELMKNPDPSVRLKAIETALRVSVAKSNSVFIPDLLRSLDDEDTTVQLGAIQALGVSGKLAMSAVPVLVGRLSEKYKPMIQIATLSALGNMGYVAAPAVGNLVKKMSDPDPDIQAAAITALGNLGKAASYFAGNAGVKKLDDLQDLLAKDLKNLAVPALIEKLADPNPHIRTLVMQALGQIGDARCVAPLLKLCGDRNPNIQALAIQSIGLMGPRAADALPKLIPYLEDKELIVRAAAIQALGNIRSAEGVPPLIKLLQDQNLDLALMAVQALAAIGKDAKDAVEPLDIFQSGRDTSVRIMVIQALGAIRSKDALKVISRELDDTHVPMVTTSLDVFANIKSEAKEYIPNIRKCLPHKDNRVCFAACRALLYMGPDAADAAPDLLKVAEDQARPQILRAYAQYVIQEVTKKDDKKENKK